MKSIPSRPAGKGLERARAAANCEGGQSGSGRSVSEAAKTDEYFLNPDALNQLLAQMVNDLGAAVNGALVILGDELGIYTALAEAGPATSQQLAKKTKLHERQLREWLSAQAASGYVSYDAASDVFFLTG
jgi:hypothetical protein